MKALDQLYQALKTRVKGVDVEIDHDNDWISIVAGKGFSSDNIEEISNLCNRFGFRCPENPHYLCLIK